MIYTPGGRSKIDPRMMKLAVPVQQRFWEQIGVTDSIPDTFEVREALAPRVASIAEVLKQGGYVTARLGKWQLGPDRQGFDIVSSNGKPGREKNYYSDPEVTFDLTGASVEFISDHHNRPFFLFLLALGCSQPACRPRRPSREVRGEARIVDKKRQSLQPDLCSHGRGR